MIWSVPKAAQAGVREVADLDQVQAERLDLGQHTVRCRPSSSPVSTMSAPRWPWIRIAYLAGVGSMRTWSRAGR